MQYNSNFQIKKILFVLTLVSFLLFSNGRFTLFFAPWISTTMLLYTVRRFSTLLGFLFTWLLLSITFLFQFYEIVPLPLPYYILMSVGTGFIIALPYLIDLLFSKKKNIFLHTLIFPISWVLIEYIFRRFNPYGTWGHTAYTQQSQLMLLQSISVFGLGYITFIISWFASVCNWVFQEKFNWQKTKKGVLAYSIVFGLTMGYGGYRLLLQKPNSETIRIASISAIEGLGIYDNDVFGLKENGAEIENKVRFRKRASKLNKNLFASTIKEAKAGAKIVFWAEGNSFILKEEEKEFYEFASAIAKKNKIYLGLGLAVIDATNDRPYENKFVLFDPNGKQCIEYWKAIPVPGAEADMSNVKGAEIQKTKTSYGTIASAICFDLDFPQYLKQAKGADILLAPSNDWKAIDPIHTDMARYRAIEQGFNMIRQTSNGLSIGADYTGRVISEMDHFTDSAKVLITLLPTKGDTTIYSIIGDIFIVFCLLLFIIVIIIIKKQTIEKMEY
jgi:apolipoprotein N-acyltransferase